MAEILRLGFAGLGEGATLVSPEVAKLPCIQLTAAADLRWGAHRDFSHAAGHQRFYGLTVVSCERGEMRQSQDGIVIYGDEKITEVPVGEKLFGRQAEIAELYEAVVHGRPMFHDGRWGEATLEVCLGILESSAERREVRMAHQVPVVDAVPVGES